MSILRIRTPLPPELQGLYFVYLKSYLTKAGITGTPGPHWLRTKIIIIIIIMGICSGTSTEWLFVHCSRSNWNLAVLIFAEGGKPENPEKNPRSEDENQQQTQPTYGTGPESNPGHIGGRRVLSPLRHPRS